MAIDESKPELYSKYINRFHDSGVLRVEAIGTDFLLTLNDFVIHVFADALVEGRNLNISHEDLVFPVRLSFKGADVTFNLVGNSGVIRQIDTVEFDEYIDEQILQFTDEFIENALFVRKNGIKN